MQLWNLGLTSFLQMLAIHCLILVRLAITQKLLHLILFNKCYAMEDVSDQNIHPLVVISLSHMDTHNGFYLSRCEICVYIMLISFSVCRYGTLTISFSVCRYGTLTAIVSTPWSVPGVILPT